MSAPAAMPITPSSPPPHPTRGGTAKSILVALVLLGAAGAYFYYQSAPPVPADGTGGAAGGGGRGGGSGRRGGMPQVPVTTAVVKSGEMKVYLRELGTVTAWDTATVHSRVDGLLLKFDVTEGQRVKAGDIVAELDSSTYEFALEQAQGQLLRDQALLNNATKDVDRYSRAGDAAPTQSLDLAVSTVAQYQGVVRTDQGVVDNDKLLLGWCRVPAPIAGRVGLRLVDAGNMIHASDNTGLIVITQDRPIAVFFSIPEDDLPQVRSAVTEGPPPVVDVFDRADTKVLATGTVIALDNQIDPATGTVRLKAEFANEDGSLFPNQFVNVRLLVRSLPDALLVPVAAVQINGPSRYVYVVGGGGKIEQRVVATGPQDGDTIAITTGLAPGEIVVTEGLDKLQTGTVVSVKSPGTGGGRRGRGDGPPPGTAGPGRGGRGGDQPGAATNP